MDAPAISTSQTSASPQRYTATAINMNNESSGTVHIYVDRPIDGLALENDDIQPVPLTTVKREQATR